jgi:uncharacterized protein YbjT (DUF2867 family)
MQKLLVTGAHGKTGLATLKALKEKCKDKYEVYAGAYSKKKSEAHTKLEEFKDFASIRDFDASDYESVKEAFKGINILFLIPPSTLNKTEHVANYIRAAKECQIEYVLLLSMVKADDSNYLYAQNFMQMEDQLAKSQLNMTVLRAGFYYQNLWLYKQQLAKGELPLPISGGKFAPVDVGDVGKVAVAIMCDWKKYTGKVYNITGPEVLTGEEMSKVITDAVGKQVRWSDIAEHEAKAILLAQNVEAFEIQGLVEFYQKVRNGEMNLISHDFENITGEQLCTLKQFFEKHKECCYEK